MWLALRTAVLFMLLCFPAHAQDVNVGPALVCDTQEQVERFVAVFRGDAQSAAKAVNTEVKDPNACEVIPAAYVWGREVATVRTDLRSYHIVRILVFGIMTQDGDILASTPTPFFSYVEVDERGA